MMIFKLGVLTCAFYVGLTVVIEAVLWAVAYFWGLGVYISGKHWGLRLGVRLGLFFGVVWLISFVAAWWIVYLDLRTKLASLPN
jgi:hypothetical protein